jgi:hypothetical protein
MEQKKNDSAKLLITAVVVIVIIIVFGVIISNEGSSQNQTAAPTTNNSPAQTQPAAQPTTQAPSAPTSTASLYTPVSIAALIKNVGNPSFENNGGGALVSFVEIQGKITKTLPGSHDNEFLLQDTSGNVALIGLGEEPDRNTKTSQIFVGNTLTVDGIFLGDVSTLTNDAGQNLPQDYSFLLTLSPTMPYVSW